VICNARYKQAQHLASRATVPLTIPGAPLKFGSLKNVTC